MIYLQSIAYSNPHTTSLVEYKLPSRDLTRIFLEPGKNSEITFSIWPKSIQIMHYY